MKNTPHTLLLIDGHAVLYRAFHAFPELTDPKGRQVNAVYGFARLLLRSILDFQPEYVAIAFDHHGPTLRHQQYPDYKAHREAMPESLRDQVAIVKEMVSVLNIPRYELAGYEADDIIGTATLHVEKIITSTPETHSTNKVVLPKIDRSIVVTGDTDLLQLVSEHTHVFLPKRGRFGKDTLYKSQDVHQKYGVPPHVLPEIKALMGDTSDNIPGVPGIGPKTAQALFKHATSLADLYAVLTQKETDLLANGISPRVIQKLRDHQESALLSLELARILRDAPIPFKIEDTKLAQYDKQQAVQFFEDLAFQSLVKLLPEDEFESGVQSALF